MAIFNVELLEGIIKIVNISPLASSQYMATMRRRPLLCLYCALQAGYNSYKMDPILAIGHDLLKIPYSVLPDNYIQHDYIYIYIPVITQIDMERLGRPILPKEIYSSAAFVGIMGVM